MLPASALALLFAGAPARAAAPTCPANEATLRAQVAEALEAAAAMDTDRLFAAQRGAREAVGCLEVLLEPEDAAAFHGVSGLAAYLTEDDASARAAFEAALGADPAWHLPAALTPEGSPLLRLVQEAQAAPEPARAPLAGTDGFFLMVDGEPSAEHPVALPWVLQVADEDWAPLWSGAIEPGASLPEAALDPARFAGGSSALAQALGERGGFERATSQRMAYGAAALGVAAVGLFVASGTSAAVRGARQHQCIEDAACVADEDAWTDAMDALHRRQIAFGWSGAGCTFLGAGLGVAALIEGRF
ncbi:MAG: hypothetical protein ABIO70_03395 [Pseudomonadota bacterium]